MGSELVESKRAIFMSTKVEKRRMEIMKIIQGEGEANVSDMAKLFKVTMETIRADFDFLAKEQGFLRTHGGIQKKEKDKYIQHFFFHERQLTNMEEKKKICFRALDFIADGDCIYVDAGSTVMYLLHYLNRRKNLTIVTHSIGFLMSYMMEEYQEIFQEQGHHLVFIGGEVDGKSRMTYGSFFEQIVGEMYYDYVLFSVDALDLSFGGTNMDYQGYATIKSVMRQARNKILLVDASKFGQKSAYKVAALDEINYLITNHELDDDWKKIAEQKHIVYQNV